MEQGVRALQAASAGRDCAGDKVGCDFRRILRHLEPRLARQFDASRHPTAVTLFRSKPVDGANATGRDLLALYDYRRNGHHAVNRYEVDSAGSEDKSSQSAMSNAAVFPGRLQDALDYPRSDSHPRHMREHRRTSMSTQRFTPEFKAEAIRQVVEHGYSLAEIAARNGCHSSSRR